MNGTSGFQARRSSTSRLPSSRFLHEQQPQFGKGSWHRYPASAHHLVFRRSSVNVYMGVGTF
jgi:hypothetical protein